MARQYNIQVGERYITSKATLDTLVKRANQRLAQLEKSELRTYNAYRYVEGIDKPYMKRIGERPRFRTDLSRMSDSELESMFREVDRFLNAKTSTVKGIKKAHEKAYKQYAEHMKEKYKQDITMEEYGQIFELTQLEILNASYSTAGQSAVATALKTGYSIEDIDEWLTDNQGRPLIEFENFANRKKELSGKWESNR